MEINLNEIAVTKIVRVTKVFIDKGASRSQTAREYNGLIFKSAGHTVYTFNSYKYTSDSTNVILIPKGGNYSFLCKEVGECYVVDFDTDTALPTDRLYQINISNSEEFLNLFMKLEHKWKFKKTSYYLKCMALMYDIFSKLDDNQKILYSISSKANIIKPSIEYIEKHYNELEISNDFLSSLSGVSTVYFRKIFSGIYNTSPGKYILLLKIEKAKELLISGSMSINEVSEFTGFGSIYHFSKTFKKITGLTPSQFARENKFKI